MTPEEIYKMEIRKIAAQSALKFFTDIKKVESSTMDSRELSWRIAAYDIIDEYRCHNPEEHIMQRFEDAARTGLGNCGEKAAICYASLINNPRLLGNSFITMASVDDMDHAIVIVTEANIRGVGSLRTSQLSKTTLIVDGWTEDWYFPNLSMFETYRYNQGNFPDSMKRGIRYKVTKSLLSTLFFDLMPFERVKAVI